MKHKKLKLTVIFMLILAVLFLTSYGFFYVTTNQSDRNRLAGSCFNPTFTDGDSIYVEDALPLTNKEGLETDPYRFTLTNSCTTKVRYYVILNVENNSFDEKYINVSLNGGEGQRLDTMPTNTLNGTIDSGYTNSYLLKTGMVGQGSVSENIRAWINDSATSELLSGESNSGFTARIKVIGMFGSDYKLATAKILDLVSGESSATTNVITKDAPSGATCTNTFGYDGTADNSLRYVGANPCNYVTFNGEEAGWRIIGVMNNVDDGTGNLETRLKLIRSTKLGTYFWDSSDSTINSGNGINDWTQADLMNELNGDYLDTKLNSNSLWYSGANNAKSATYDYTKGLTSSAQKLIGDTKWYLGGITNAVSNMIPSTMYTEERGTNVLGVGGRTCNDDYCPRNTQWTGKVALMYPSDYGFATAGGATTSRTNCINSLSTNSTSSGATWRNSSYTNCKDNDWLRPSSSSEVLLSPHADGYYYMFVTTNGYVYNNASYIRDVYPVLYLSSSAKITSGDGTQTNPYVIG